jgi:hypothetical protein
MGYTLNPLHGVLTSTSGYSSTNLSSNPSVVSQYCNGSRVPPEAGGLGYQVPAGVADSVVPNPIFSLTPNATVDEGNNWVNISWGPLSMLNPVTSPGTTNVVLGNYSLQSGSPDIDAIALPENIGQSGVTTITPPATDFFGNPRPDAGNTTHVDIGAVELRPPAFAVLAVTPTSLTFPSQLVGTTSAAMNLTLANSGGAGATGIGETFTGPFSRATGGAAGTCGATLAAGASCTIGVVFTPTAVGPVTGSAAIAASVTVAGSPVTLNGTGAAATHTATVAPSPLAFGNWAVGTTSNVQNLTVTNTGNSALAGGTFTGIAAPFTRVTTGTFPAGAPNCGAALAVGNACTIKVQFAPTASTAYTDSLTVAYTGATVTPTPVSLTGTGVAARATVTVTPLTITLPSGTLSGTGTVTVTNTSNATTGASFTVATVAVTGAGATGGVWFFNAVAGSDTCTGTTLAPQTSCTVGVRYTNARPGPEPNHTGTITITDNGAGSPQTAVLTGIAN